MQFLLVAILISHLLLGQSAIIETGIKTFGDLLKISSNLPQSEKVIYIPSFGFDSTSIAVSLLKQCIFESEIVTNLIGSNGLNLVLYPSFIVDEQMSKNDEGNFVIGCISSKYLSGDSSALLHSVHGILKSNFQKKKKSNVMLIIYDKSPREESYINSQVLSVVKDAWEIAASEYFTKVSGSWDDYLDISFIHVGDAAMQGTVSARIENAVFKISALLKTAISGAVPASSGKKIIESSPSAKLWKEKNHNLSGYDILKNSTGAAASAKVAMELENFVDAFVVDVKTKVGALISANKKGVPISSSEVSAAVEEAISFSIGNELTQKILTRYRQVAGESLPSDAVEGVGAFVAKATNEAFSNAAYRARSGL